MVTWAGSKVTGLEAASFLMTSILQVAIGTLVVAAMALPLSGVPLTPPQIKKKKMQVMSLFYENMPPVLVWKHIRSVKYRREFISFSNIYISVNT